MGQFNLELIRNYVTLNIGDFHTKRLESLTKLNLEKILGRKNPYLFRAKNLGPSEMIKSIADAFLSSNEETIFGDWLENLAIFVNHSVHNGWKSGIPGIDLEFDSDSVRYIVSIKSGPNWGNSSQVKKMKTDFISAIKTLRTSNNRMNVIPVNGCCYGKDRKPNKGDYFKFCGQDFWNFISGDPDLYKDIIISIGHEAKLKNDEFFQNYMKIITLLQKDFLNNYCLPNGSVNWDKIIELNSASSIIT